MPQLQDSFVLEFGVCLGYRVMTDDQFLSEGTDSGKLIAVTEDARFHCVADLLHQLKVEGLAGLGI